jgi:hypothetical protein
MKPVPGSGGSFPEVKVAGALKRPFAFKCVANTNRRKWKYSSSTETDVSSDNKDLEAKKIFHYDRNVIS